MARLATLAVLLLSLLAVASCRVLEAESAISDDPVVLTQDDQADAAVAEVTLPRLPTPTVGGGEGVLRLPSHRRPCHLHRHLWWARHHGLSHQRAAFSGPGVVPTVLAHVEEQEPREAELVAVAEPDPDSRPDTDAEPKQFHGEEEGEAAKAWKVEMLRRFRHGIRFQHGHHHEHDGEEHDDQEKVNDEDADTKLFGRFHHRHHHRHHLRHHHEHDDVHEQEDKNEGINTKLFGRFHHHHHAQDSDGEVDEVEELARRLSEAIMRRRVGHGGHQHHHHHHRAAEGGVKKWFKGLMNRF